MLFGAQRNTIHTDHIRMRNEIIRDAAVIIARGLGKCRIARGFGKCRIAGGLGKCSIAGGFGKCSSCTIG